MQPHINWYWVQLNNYTVRMQLKIFPLLTDDAESSICVF